MSISKLPWKGRGNNEDDSEHDDQTTAIDPRQWSNKVRRGAAVTMGLFAFLEPFASSMIAPSLPLIAEEFGITSSVERSVSAKIQRNEQYLCQLTVDYNSSFFHRFFFLTHSELSYWRPSRRQSDVSRLWCRRLASFSCLLSRVVLLRAALKSSSSECWQDLEAVHLWLLVLQSLVICMLPKNGARPWLSTWACNLEVPRYVNAAVIEVAQLSLTYHRV
jgi:hypothetical protein